MSMVSSVSPVGAVSAVTSGSAAAAEKSAAKAAQYTGASRDMPKNAAAATIMQARSDEKTAKTGAVTDSREMTAKVQAEFENAPPSIVESMIKQAVGGGPGSTVTELSRFIDQTSPDQQAVDLSQSRMDAKDRVSQLRNTGEQAMREGQAERAEARQADAAGHMTERIMSTKGQQGAYSTLSLAAVSHEAQISRRMSLSI